MILILNIGRLATIVDLRRDGGVLPEGDYRRGERVEGLVVEPFSPEPHIQGNGIIHSSVWGLIFPDLVPPIHGG
jgi:hypothetical protein